MVHPFHGMLSVSLPNQNEIIEMRKAILDERLNSFVRDRLSSSIYYKYIEFIEKLDSLKLEGLNNFNDLIDLTE